MFHDIIDAPETIYLHLIGTDDIYFDDELINKTDIKYKKYSLSDSIMRIFLIFAIGLFFGYLWHFSTTIQYKHDVNNTAVIFDRALDDCGYIISDPDIINCALSRKIIK